MAKQDLVGKVAEKTGLSKKAAAEAVDAVFDGILEDLEVNESLPIRGFGTFNVVDRKARTSRNPRTGEPVEVAAHRALAFKPSKQTKERFSE